MSGQQLAKNPKYIESENDDLLLLLLNRKIDNAIAGLDCINYYHKLAFILVILLQALVILT
jgi:hypothetical protein